MTLIFDIGAFKGEYTDRYLAEGAQVIAVEAQAEKAHQLRQKYGEAVTVVSAAVGAKAGKEVFYKSGASWLAALIPQRWAIGRFADYPWHPVGEVEVITLDDLIDRYGMPDFIKIDVEGGELEALQGLTRPAPLLSYEFSCELLDDTEQCGRHLLGIGDYEFSISYYRDDKAGKYTSLEEVMDKLRADKSPLLWGNIYARLRHG